MHSKFHQQIDNKVSVTVDSLPDRKNGPRVPNPSSYEGSSDTEVFERWLNTLLRWLKVSKISGPDLNAKRIEYTGMYLEEIALTWFEDNVDGVYRHKAHWKFKDVITSLYDWFIHDNATHDSVEGVMSYYHKLE
jgi:hypothetical protein